MTKKEAGYWAGLKKLTEAADDDVEICKRSVAEAAGQSRGPLSTNKKYAPLCEAIEDAEADRIDRVRDRRDPGRHERSLARQLQAAVSLCANYELENRKLKAQVTKAENRRERAARNEARRAGREPTEAENATA